MTTVVTLFQAKEPKIEAKIGYTRDLITEQYNNAADAIHQAAQSLLKLNAFHPEVSETPVFAIVTDHGSDIVEVKDVVGKKPLTETRLGPAQSIREPVLVLGSGMA